MNRMIPLLRRGADLYFWLSALVAISLIFSTILQPLLQDFQQSSKFYQGYHNELLSKALASDTWTSFTPVLAGIPFAAGYLEDVKSKFSRFILVRAN